MKSGADDYSRFGAVSATKKSWHFEHSYSTELQWRERPDIVSWLLHSKRSWKKSHCWWNL